MWYLLVLTSYEDPIDDVVVRQGNLLQSLTTCEFKSFAAIFIAQFQERQATFISLFFNPV